MEDLGLISGLGRSPGEGNGNPLQYFCLENSLDRRAWPATVHGITKSQTQPSSHAICKTQSTSNIFERRQYRPSMILKNHYGFLVSEFLVTSYRKLYLGTMSTNLTGTIQVLKYQTQWYVIISLSFRMPQLSIFAFSFLNFYILFL